ITGRSLGTFFAEEIAKPLGADYHIGTGHECDARVSKLIRSQSAEDESFKLGDTVIQRGSMDVLFERAYFNPHVSPDEASTVPWRRAELGGSNGHGNARSVALVQSILANGGQAQGVRLLSEAGCARAFEVQTDGIDRLLGMAIRWGLGYFLNSPTFTGMYGKCLQGRRTAYWGGSGGSCVLVDLDARMTIAFVMNKHVEGGGYDQRSVDIVNAAYDSLARETKTAQHSHAGVASRTDACMRTATSMDKIDADVLSHTDQRTAGRALGRVVRGHDHHPRR